MLPEDDLQQRWLKLESKLTERLGNKPAMDDVLIFIGIRESGLPPKTFTEKEKIDLIQMAVCTILVPARYYEMMWVDDFGWPYFKEIQRLPAMTIEERAGFLKQYVVAYAEKHRII